MCLPAGDPDVTTTVSPSRVVFSWMTIVSAPGGTTPPVKMRAASPSPTLAAERMAGRDFADHLERRRHCRDARRAHRVAVHRREILRRLRAQRRDVGGEHAAMRVGQRGLFGGQGPGIRQHASQCVGDRQQVRHD